MSALRVFAITTIGLFSLVGAIGLVKKKKAAKGFNTEQVALSPIQEEQKPISFIEEPVRTLPIKEQEVSLEPVAFVATENVELSSQEEAPFVDRMYRLFTSGKEKLPFVETVTYKSRVSWLQGRPAWVTDYASYYNTSRHFIARSLNGTRDYYTQKVSTGDHFNVFRKDKDIRFYLVVDLSKLIMHVYAYDAGINTRYFLKTYRVGCGKVDKNSPSGSLTALGSFNLGDKVAIYKPGVEGYFKDQKVEMIQVFGTRWLPYGCEQDEATALAKGFGIHGVPWVVDETTGQLVEDRSAVGCFNSSGCVRLLQEDVEELFAVVITKPTSIQIVKNFQEAKLPGIEWTDDSILMIKEGK